MPSKEVIDNKSNAVLSAIEEKKKKDCEFMYNLLNKTLNEAVNSKNQKRKHESEFDANMFDTYSSMNIENCDGFKEYNKALKERGITYEYYKGSSRINWIQYYPENKKLEVYGR